jgi:RNA polymerase sigma factor (sigma-70 family)
LDIPQLVLEAKAGDKEALTKLIIDKQDEYYRLAYVYTENKEDSFDAIADMTVIVYQHIKKLRNEEMFYSWSKTILVNCCKTIIKQRRRIVFFEEYPDKGREEKYNLKEARIDIMNCFKKLNDRQQEVIRLKYFMDMDYESISKISNVAIGTVKSRAFEGLKKLNKCFGGEY